MAPMQSGVTLPPDHPGVHDERYRQRRAHIAAVGASYRPGEPVPEIDYTPQEDAVWSQVSGELAVLHEQVACRAYLDAAARIDLPGDRVPQLREVDERLRRFSGFAFHPAPGLAPALEFFADLSRRVFPATQYVRHHSVPFYTPEPDVIHELLGHACTLAEPRFADLYQAAGSAALRTETPAALEVLGHVFWFTLEFGIVDEAGGPKAYGSGLLSSFGELQTFPQADIRPWSVPGMATQTYDHTAYQPVLFSAPSTAFVFDELRAFFDQFDDDEAGRLVATSPG